MQLHVRKIGNSSGVVIPAPLLQQLHASVGSKLNVTVENGKLTLVAARPSYRLADLMAEMPKELPRVDEWDDMKPAGLEAP